MSDTKACAACDEPISVDANRCPECGNDPAKSARLSFAILIGAGVVLTFIVPLLGIPVILIGIVGRVGMHFADYSPTEVDASG